MATILARLAPIRQQVVMRPLAEDEIAQLERQVGLSMPTALREYLGEVGLLQDLTSYGASGYELFERQEQFVEQRQNLLKNFGDGTANLFPLADDGAGNIVAATQMSEETLLFFCDHETGEIEELGTFNDWLAEVVDAALKQDRPPNGEKVWCVQFSFRVPDAEPIVEVLHQFDTANLGEWTSKGATPAGVHSYEAPLAFGSKNIVLKRLEYHTWNQPMFSMDLEEPVALAPDQSRIRKLDSAFKAAGLGYKLVDYGPLPLKALLEHVDKSVAENSAPKPSTQRGDSSKPNRPWWRFWR